MGKKFKDSMLGNESIWKSLLWTLLQKMQSLPKTWSENTLEVLRKNYYLVFYLLILLLIVGKICFNPSVKNQAKHLSFIDRLLSVAFSLRFPGKLYHEGMKHTIPKAHKQAICGPSIHREQLDELIQEQVSTFKI